MRQLGQPQMGQKPPAAQLKRTTPVAPPAYRPQPVPKVLQAKMAPTPPAAQLKQPAAPPAYRPQPVPRVLQTKRATGSSGLKTTKLLGQTPSRPTPPLRPSARPIVQRKMTRGAPPLGTRIAIQMAVDKKSKAFVPMDLQDASFSTVTAMLYIDSHGDGSFKCIGKFRSTKKGHAEEHILDYLRDHMYSGSAQVVIELTSSPCGEKYRNCAGQLKSFMEDEAEGRGIAGMKIKALGFYKGERDAMLDASELKSVDGMDFEVWDVFEESRAGGAAEGYDNSQSLENFMLASVLQEPKKGRKLDVPDRVMHNQEKFAKFVLGE